LLTEQNRTEQNRAISYAMVRAGRVRSCRGRWRGRAHALPAGCFVP
jgi:hypothetical protein